MPSLSPYYNNADTVSVSSDGVTSGASAYGSLLEQGSDLPDFTVATEAMLDGRELATGSSAAYVIRVLNPDTTVTTDLQTARDDGTDRYFHFTNRSGGKVFVLGPALVTRADERPPTSTQARGSVIVAFNVAGDTPADFHTVETVT